jgi:hypothetical protein
MPMPEDLFVADDFRCFEVPDGRACADVVTVRRRDGKVVPYRRCTPAVYAQLRARLASARVACRAGRLDAGRLAAAEERYAAIAEWAGEKTTPDLTLETRSG